MPPLFYARAMLRKMSFVPDGEGRTAISHQENRSCFFKERNVKYIQKFKLKEIARRAEFFTLPWKRRKVFGTADLGLREGLFTPAGQEFRREINEKIAVFSAGIAIVPGDDPAGCR